MRLIVTAAVLLFFARIQASELHSVEPPVNMPPSGWKVAGPAPRAQMVELTFAVKQRGLQELTEHVLRTSDPFSPDYGRHFANDEVQRLTAPHPVHLAAVEQFLRENGLHPRRATPNGDFVVATVTIAEAEELLSTRYVTLVHKKGTEVSRVLEGYKLPAEVAAAIDFVAPTTHVPDVRWSSTDEATAHAANVSLPDYSLFNSPKTLRELYQVGSAEGQAASNKQAVTAFLNQGFSELSLKTFWRLMCGGIRCGKGSPKLVGDKTRGLVPGVEAMLDIETVTGVAGNVESEFWGFAGKSPDNPQNEPFLKWLMQLSSTSDADVPKIFSTSYGEDEGSWSLAAAQRLNVEFQKAGARGISLLFASGDSGPSCKDGKFRPNGPASSPWVTAVGGTSQGKTWPKPGPDAETGVGLSSGGFSNYWPMPDWQKDAVAGYLKQSGVPDAASKGYNASGRAFPDISAQAVLFFVVAGIPQPGVAGTSCASPTAAGVFALLNDLRLQQGKSTLGFLNPFVYAHTEAFSDITKGAGVGSCGKWSAKKGWDAVTGVGTPNYKALAEAVARLPPGRQPFPAGAEVIV